MKLFLHSTSNDPFENLAMEEYLIKEFPPTTQILFLYKNNPCVVMGRNQNPWMETNSFIVENNISLTRRISGGGAVYHDLGNLNFCLIGKSNFEIILESLRTLNIPFEKNAKSDLLLDGKKFSGSAFYVLGNKRLHHGTLLLNSNLENLYHALKPTFKEFQTLAISSRRVEVININLAENDMLKTLKDKFHMDETVSLDEIMKNPNYQIILNRYHSFEWIFGKTPEFSHHDTLYHPSKWNALPSAMSPLGNAF